jgi:hypothetical protein
MKKIVLLLCLFLAGLSVRAQYATPGTGVRLSLANLVTASAAKGSVTYNGGVYFVNDSIKISQNDTLLITTNETLKLENKILITIAGTLIINPPDSVKITAVNTANHFHSLRFEEFSDASVLRKTIVEYGSGIKIVNADIRIDRCIIRYNDRVYNSGAINLSGCRPRITNSKFIRNSRSAILTPANIASAPIIRNNWFFENSTENANYPQINLGPSGNDTIYITGNTVIGINTPAYNAGGISVSNLLATGSSGFFMQGNHISTNRYGIGVVGNNLKGYIKRNKIEGNNVNPNALTGGSGINFNSSTSTQQVVAARNIIRNNQWGITIQSGSSVTLGPKPMLGRIGSTDTANVGLNQIYNNFNVGTSGQVWDLYNNTTDSIYAENNFWGTTNLADIEDHIYHKVDNNLHGFVKFTSSPVVSGLNAEIAKGSLLVYPNPAQDLITFKNAMVSGEKGTVRFYNSVGKVVLRAEINASETTVNTQQLPNGFYTYRLDNGSKTVSGKLVINR